MFNIKEFINGIRLKAKAVLSSDTKGELEVDDTSGKLNYHNGGTRSPIVTESHTATLTNKTFDANGTGNTLSNVETSDLASGVLNTSTTLSGASDTQVPSALAVKTYVDNGLAAQNEANEISFDNVSSGYASSDVQGAIDEAASKIDDVELDIDNHLNDTTDAHDASAISVVATGNLGSTEVQAALEELQTDIDTNATNISDHISESTDAHDASAISNSPSGNLAATDVQGALNELQTDVDTRALDSDLTTHTSATAAHGVTGNVVGTTDSQTLTNKTITNPILDAGATFSEIATPANPSAGQKKLYPKSDGKFYTLDSSGNEIPVGSGNGSLDIFYSDDFEIGSATYTTGNNASFDGGGSIVGAKADETSSPLANTKSLKYTMHASSGSANDYVASAAIALDEKQQSNWVGISGYYTYNGDDEDVEVVLFDDTNDEILSRVELEASSSSKRFEFAAFIPASCSSLKWGIRVLTHNSGKILLIDDVQISTNPFVYKQLSNDTDWEAYTPLFDGFGTTSALEIYWRRVGDTIEVKGRFNAGTPTATEGRIYLPSNLFIDSAKIGVGVNQLVGRSIIANAGSGEVKSHNMIAFGGHNYVRFSHFHYDVAANPFTALNGSSIADPSDTMSFNFSAPIAGWSATSEHTITPMDNVPTVSYASSAAQSIPSGADTIIDFATVDSSFPDTDGLVTTGASWRYTAKVKGKYEVNTMVELDDSADNTSKYLGVWKNGSLVKIIDKKSPKDIDTDSNSLSFSGTYTVDLDRNQYVDVRLFQATGSAINLSANANTNWIQIKRIDKNPIGAFPDNFCVGDVRTSLLTETQFQSLNGDKWVLMDGRAVTGSRYHIITGSSSIPDARGVFLRGKNNSRSDGNQDPDGERALGNLQLDKTRIPRNTNFTTNDPGNHSHSTNYYNVSALNTGSSMPYGAASTGVLGSHGSNGAGSHTHSITGGGDNETTPRNIAVNYFIKIN